MLRTALERRESLTLSLAAIGAHGLLPILAEDGDSYHVRIMHETTLVEVEIGNGIVMGARAERDGQVLQGRAAYVLLRTIHNGIAFIEPKRFLSMANVLEPIGSLPDLTGSSSSPPPMSESDTVELPVLEARPSHPAPIVDDAATEENPSLPPPVPRRKTPRAEPPKKRSPRVLAFAGIALGVWGAAAGVIAALLVGEPATPARAEPIVPGALAITVAEVAPEPEPVVIAEEEEPAVASADARTLAREARAHLRAGRNRRALSRARQALRLRPGVPYYQDLLGDAFAANGQDEDARRMWRRAQRARGHRVSSRRSS